MAKYRNYTMITALAVAMMLAPLQANAQQSITVTLDKQAYATGDTLTVNGKVPRVITGLDVIIQIINPKNAQAALAQVTPATDGSFSKEFKLGGTLMKDSGTYTVRITYGDLQQTATFTFTAAEQPTAREFSVRVSGIQENITIRGTLDRGKVDSITIDQDFNSLVFTLSNVTASSRMSVTIPPDILREPNMFNMVNFIVLVDGEALDEDEVRVSTQGNNKVLTFTIPAETEDVEIVVIPENISVVPEFGVIAALILAVSIGALVALSRKSILTLPPSL
jgi:predicted secreted protein with PEFG-CTERM motif